MTAHSPVRSGNYGQFLRSLVGLVDVTRIEVTGSDGETVEADEPVVLEKPFGNRGCKVVVAEDFLQARSGLLVVETMARRRR